MKALTCACFLALAVPCHAQTSVPEIAFDSVPDFPKLPDGMNFGEVPGVAVNSKGHVFVFTRSNSANGPAYAPTAAQLLEFDGNGEFIREVGKGLYGWSFAHSVRIDKDDNIWAIDKGSDMIIKFNPAGRVLWVFGRRKESADAETKPWEHVQPPLPPVDGLFRQPTDVAWDSQGNTYISDGYINSRVAKYDKNGDWVKSWGEPGTGPGQFRLPHAIAIDNHDNIYVGDRSNRRIQVFDTDGKFLRMFTIDVPPVPGTHATNGNTPTGARLAQVIGAPNSICITPGQNQVMFVGEIHLSRTHFQSVARRQGFGRDRPFRTSVEGVLRRARARLSVRNGNLCRRNLELAGAEADPAYTDELSGSGARFADTDEMSGRDKARSVKAEEDTMSKDCNVRRFYSMIVPAAAVLTATILALAPIAGSGQTADLSVAAATQEWHVDPLRGPVDLGIMDPALVGAIDVHVHLDPDAPGTGGVIRAIDAFDAAVMAKARGLRGFVLKMHQDAASAGIAYLVRKHGAPGLEIYGRMASNYATGGVNVAALEHFSQIKGGWGRIFEMPTRDSITATTRPGSMDPAALAQSRPWMLMMPPGTPAFIAVSKDGELLPEVKYLIAVLAKLRTVDSNGRMVLATGHATPQEHLLLAREARQQGLNVLLTHPGDIPQLPEAARLGAFIELTASTVYKTEAARAAGAAFVHKIGAEHIIVSTDCGQTNNVYPTDCLALAARGLRAHGVTQHELDMMYKVNPAKLLDLPPPEETLVAAAPVR